MSTEFDKILHFDPLQEAENISGKSYKEDRSTMIMGMMLLQQSEQRKADELALRGDTHARMSFFEAVDVALGAGFEPVYAQILPDMTKYGNGEDVHFYAYWRRGVLLTLESYGPADRLIVNSAHIYFNWRSADGGTSWPDVPFSGGWRHRSEGFEDVEGDPWTLVASIDVRAGLLHYLDVLGSSGEFLETWYITDSLYSLHSYAEREDEEERTKDSYERRAKKSRDRAVDRVNQFSEPAKSAILAGIPHGRL